MQQGRADKPQAVPEVLARTRPTAPAPTRRPQSAVASHVLTRPTATPSASTWPNFTFSEFTCNKMHKF